MDLSYSLRDPLKDPHFSLPGPPQNLPLSHNSPVSILTSEGFTFQALLMKTEKVQKYIYVFILFNIFIHHVVRENVQLCEPAEACRLDRFIMTIH